jgi:ABC-type methionine transport system ATPase subunit
MALLSIEGVSKQYRHGRRDVVVLDDVWLEVEVGEFVGIWGARRSGKSTLLRVACGIELPDSGVVRIDGRDLARLSAAQRSRLLRRDIGFAATSLESWRGWNASRSEGVLDHVALPLISEAWDLDEATVRAREELDRVGAVDCADATPFELSSGEATRVALARALIRRPRLLLVDEPAITLNPTERDEIRELLHALAGASKLTVIVASEEVAALRGAQRVVSIGDGRLLSTDRPGTVVPFPGERTARTEHPAS